MRAIMIFICALLLPQLAGAQAQDRVSSAALTPPRNVPVLNPNLQRSLNLTNEFQKFLADARSAPKAAGRLNEVHQLGTELRDNAEEYLALPEKDPRRILFIERLKSFYELSIYAMPFDEFSQTAEDVSELNLHPGNRQYFEAALAKLPPGTCLKKFGEERVKHKECTIQNSDDLSDYLEEKKEAARNKTAFTQPPPVPRKCGGTPESYSSCEARKLLLK